MIRRYTEEEMLAYWKRRLGLAVSPAVTGGEDNNGLDRKLIDDIRVWYADILQNAPPQLVNCENLADEATAGIIGDNCMAVTLPERGTRLVSVRLKAWETPVTRMVRPESPVAALQTDPLTRATVDDPVVVEGTHRLFLYGLPLTAEAAVEEAGGARVPPHRPLPEIASLEMTAWPADGTYVFDPGLLRHSRLLLS